MSWGRLGIAVGGALLGGWMLGPIGMSAGFLAGSYLGSMIFPTDYESKMPKAHDFPIQSSAVGTPIAIVFGTMRLAGNIVWMGDLVSYQVAHSAGGGKGGGKKQVSYETKYRRSFLIAICEGPAIILRAWKGKVSIPLTEFTTFNGIGNSGISTLIGKDYAEYNNLCLAYFEDYELGNGQAIPNFVFEVSSNLSNLICGGTVDLDYGQFCGWIIDSNGIIKQDVLTGYSVISYASAVCANGEFYMSKGHSVWKFNADGTVKTSWQTNGEKGGFGNAVRDLALDANENLYVANTSLGTSASINTIHKLDSNGDVIWSAIPLNYARLTSSVVIGKDGYVYICGSKPTGSAKRGTKLNPATGVPIVYYDGYYGSYIGIDDSGNVYSAGGQKVYRFLNNGTWLVTHTLDNWGALRSIFVMGNGSGVFVTGQHETTNKSVWKLNATLFNVVATYGAYLSYTIIGDSDGNILVGGAPTQTGEDGKYQIVKLRASDLAFIWGLKFNEAGCFHINRQSLSATFEYDMNFAAMIKALLTDVRYGGYAGNDLITEDFDSIIAYCEDNELKGSLVITEQKALPDWISYICSHFQGYFYEIGGKVGLNCYRSQDSVLSITQDDLIRDGDAPPVHTTKRAYSSTHNRLEASWTDRTNNYKTAVVPAFDRIDQRESGQLRTKLFDLKAITNNELASKMTWRIFIDQLYRFSQYTFKLGYKSMLLEVGDVIDVTDGHLLTAKKMRVMSISEEKDGRKALITANEDIADFYPALSYEIQQSEATLDPDITLTDGIITFRENYIDNRLYLSITPSGAQVNGFYIYMSYDDESYELIGKAAIENVTGGEANSVGTIQSNLPAYTTVIHRKDEAFNVNIGTINDLASAINDEQFFNNRKLAKIGNEIIGYKTCVESSVTGIWRVSNLIRGLFGTEPVVHNPDEMFSTLDISFIYTLKESDIGKTLYFKVVSFYADDVQDKSDVSSYSITISGKYLKPLPVSLMRINGREGLSTYKTSDVTLDWYFCSKTSGFGRGGYGNALWGAYTKDPLLERLKVELEEEDTTPITDSNYELDAYGEPTQLEILEADRNGKNPIVVKLSPMSNLLGDSRQITIEKI